MSIPKNDEVATVITLVHGTFARGAAWTQEGSQLRTRLEEAPGLGTVHFEVFEWSGKNSDTARLDGAEQLAKRLRENLKSFSNAKHFVVGHSHGGNVILRALDGFEQADRIAGAVSLATPFIQCEARDPERAVRRTRDVSLVLLTVLTVVLVFSVVKNLGDSLVVLARCVLGGGFAAWLIASAILWLRICKLTGPLGRFITRKQAEYIARYDHQDLVRTPFFCAASRIDEAGVGLRMGTRLAESPVLLDRILGWVRLFLWIAILASGCWWAQQEFGVDAKSGLPALILLVISVLLQMLLAVVRTVLGGLRIGIVEFVRRLFFGSGGMLMNSFVKFTTSTKPAGVAHPPTLKLYDVNVGFVGLRHSAIYTTESVLQDVAAWIRDTATATNQASP